VSERAPPTPGMLLGLPPGLLPVPGSSQRLPARHHKRRAQSRRLQSARDAPQGKGRNVFAVPKRGRTNPSRHYPKYTRAPETELASRGGKSKIFVVHPQPMEGRDDQGTTFCVTRWQPDCPFDVVFNHLLSVVSYLSPSTVEETDVRKIGAQCCAGSS